MALISALICTPDSPLLARNVGEITYPAGAPKIISDFRSRTNVRGGLRLSVHQGIDLAGPNGSQIIAAADGRVLETDVGSCWGPTVVIDHGIGRDGKPLIAAYGHLGQMQVKSGQSVRRGQLIGTLGNNQRDFRCIGGVRHLHFQLGRAWRGPEKGTFWGHMRYLRDGKRGTNPHQYWADGPNRVTCFDAGRSYPAGTLTYPVPCAGGA
ncbi:M23 family metallopeptidase [Tateyamaria omphalii]|uniref:M23 family metallopeptidase n=1 Tax=Tateyamaria omphalii TaxID=299262 RepID=UPI001C98F79F|nr:M23 family metallopeptidase [Tateyamaria omphalii]MBY5934327.1 M23 family metallopeptidase [Tateyamaria omphalii]